MNSDLQAIQYYTSRYSLKVNSDKYFIMIFGPKYTKNFIKSHLNVMLDNNELKSEESVKLLGIMFDQNLRLKNHIDMLRKMLYTSPIILSKLSYNQL